MKRFEGRLAVVLFATVLCMGAFSGCKKDEPAEPDLYEGEEYYEEDDQDEYYEEEPYEEETEDSSSENDEVAIGKWYTEDYDETDNWANSYCLELKEDGVHFNSVSCREFGKRYFHKYKELINRV